MTDQFDRWVKIVSLVGAAATFVWGVVQFVAMQSAQAETRRVEATKPFLERQLKLYTEATQAAATLATATKADDLDAARRRFWSLEGLFTLRT